MRGVGSRTLVLRGGTQGGSVREPGGWVCVGASANLSAEKHDEDAGADNDRAHQDNGTGTKKLGHLISP